ncbi:MAG: adenine phosphoribosyltransferase [Thermoplasmata archaeon]|nr:adenine phosphoribosyltransferase [Thermoplasmata archaeon]NIS12008.1 adenine phosphoribosyltransferase [Thermoplasmata archaeon]NIV78693.1 adenine phosphoribosyltransferase [Thermoplasmata archaeon]NIW82529.1 adenine phosphoribosyltransferase [Thermoplasmata archaeon]NIW88746.1 adenine phosphoribosyltransferase [Thermoplasmata archaeon]
MNTMVRSLLRESLENVPIVDKGGYQYFVHPLTDGANAIEPLLLEEVTLELMKESTFDCDKIVTVEAMGIPLATLLSHKTRKPFVIIRKRQYYLPGEVEITASTGYSKNNLYINGLEKGDRVIIVDDVLSTGGTLIQTIKTLKEVCQVDVREVHLIFNKHEHPEEIEAAIGMPINVMLNVKVVDGKVVEFTP